MWNFIRMLARVLPPIVALLVTVLDLARALQTLRAWRRGSKWPSRR